MNERYSGYDSDWFMTPKDLARLPRPPPPPFLLLFVYYTVCLLKYHFQHTLTLKRALTVLMGFLLLQFVCTIILISLIYAFGSVHLKWPNSCKLGCLTEHQIKPKFVVCHNTKLATIFIYLYTLS